MEFNKILVTGSSGFIGTHLISHLSGHDCTVIGLDIRQPLSTNFANHVNCDLLDREQLINTIRDIEPDAIVHLAARTDLNGYSVDDYLANSLGVANLIQAIRETPSVKRCLFTSSQLVCKVGYIPQGDKDYCPPNAYGESKVLTEQAVRSEDGGDITWCLFRPTTIWGGGMNDHYASFFNRLKRGQYFHPGKQDLYKSYGYVGNTVFQIYQFLEAPSESIHRQVYYLADYVPISLPVWINAIAAGLGRKHPPVVPLFLCRGLSLVGDLFRYAGLEKYFPLNSFRLNNILTQYTYDMTKTKNICGALPNNFEEGVAALVAWINRTQNESHQVQLR